MKQLKIATAHSSDMKQLPFNLLSNEDKKIFDEN